MNQPPAISEVITKSIIVHSVTYFLVGLTAFLVFDYASSFSAGGLELWMRPTDHPLVTAGPLFQPIRGLLFGVVFFLFREAYLENKQGWLKMWAALVVFGIISTFGPAPGSIEGLIYTSIPIRSQLSLGMLEVLTQSLLLSFLVHYWVNHPRKKWLNWVLGVLFSLTLLLPLAGMLAANLS